MLPEIKITRKPMCTCKYKNKIYKQNGYKKHVKNTFSRCVYYCKPNFLNGNIEDDGLGKRVRKGRRTS